MYRISFASPFRCPLFSSTLLLPPLSFHLPCPFSARGLVRFSFKNRFNSPLWRPFPSVFRRRYTLDDGPDADKGFIANLTKRNGSIFGVEKNAKDLQFALTRGYAFILSLSRTSVDRYWNKRETRDFSRRGKCECAKLRASKRTLSAQRGNQHITRFNWRNEKRVAAVQVFCSEWLIKLSPPSCRIYRGNVFYSLSWISLFSLIHYKILRR